MHNFRSALMLAATLVGTSGSALGGTLGAFDISNAPDANTAVAVIADQVTYAKPGEGLKTFVAFNVGSGAYLLKNKSKNTLNNITVHFTASVTDPDEKLKLSDPATYLAGLIAAGCIIPTDTAPTLVITCQVTQLKTGATFLLPFTVFYEAPFKVTGVTPPVGDDPGSDKVRLDINIVYAEGTNGKNPTNNSVDLKNGTAATLGTENPTFVKSALPHFGGTFFSGRKGIPNRLSGDEQATTVVFNAFTSASYSTVAILETPDAPDNSDCIQLAFFKTCYTTLLSAPNVVYEVGAYLTETIRVLKDNLLPGAASKADTLKWYYTPTDAAGVPGAVSPVELCATGPTPRSDGIPCQTKPGICYKSSDAPTPDLIDVCVWEFINTKNGYVKSYL